MDEIEEERMEFEDEENEEINQEKVKMGWRKSEQQPA